MKTKYQTRKPKGRAQAKVETQPVAVAAQPAAPEREAFLEEAKQEPKRLLLLDHIKTIQTLRDEKKFTFRAIATWLNQHGFDTDHSAVYRVYLCAIPENQRDPSENWDEAALEEQ